MTQGGAPGDLLAALRRRPVIGIVRARDGAAARQHLDTMIGAGLTAVEVSLATPGALQVVSQVAASVARDRTPDHDVHVGVGTVMTVDELHASVDAGARFVVTPTTDAGVLAAAVERGVAIVPGAATPTEVQRAVAGGAVAVKLFPASLWSIAAFRDLRSVFPDVPFVPTGGVRDADAPAWLEAGAVAVGMGSALTSGELDIPELIDTLRRAGGQRGPAREG